MWWVVMDFISFGCVCFFFYFLFFIFKVALVDVGLCQWWLSVLLRQWLLVVVVAAMVVKIGRAHV